MQSPSSQQACPIPCSLVREVDTREDSSLGILPILLSHKEEVIHQHILLLGVVTHLPTPLSLVMEEHRELEGQGTLPTPHKQVEQDTPHILHQGGAILSSPSRLGDRTA